MTSDQEIDGSELQKVIGYLQPSRGGGVARHARKMLEGLHRNTTVRLEVCASRRELHKSRDLEWLGPLAVRSHVFPQRALERSWKATSFPPANWVLGEADWIYAPAEVRLPRCKSRTAITVHDVQALEANLPWSQTKEHMRFALKWRAWLRKMFAEADLILTVSEFSKQRMVELAGAPGERVVVIGNGVDDIFFRQNIDNAEADIDRDPHLVVLGGLRTKKGAEYVVGLAREFVKQRVGLRFDIVGQNDPYWEDIARTLPNISLRGWLADEEVSSLMNSAVALLFLSPYEGFGIPALEAMASGCPVIAANRASLPEVVADSGVLVDPGNGVEVQQIVERIWNDRPYRSQLIEAGHVRAQQFRWSQCVDRLVEALQSHR